MTEEGQLQVASSIIWKIENFSKKSSTPGEFITSPIFESGVCNNKTYPKWYLKLYPFGYNQEYKDYLSLFLGFTLQPTSTKYECTFEISIQNGDQSDINTTKLRQSRRFTTEDLTIRGWRRFIDRNVLFEEKATWLKQDTLIISCLVSDIPSQTIQQVSSLFDGIESLYLTEDLSDVTIIVDNKNINVHKAILSARSKVFLAMFKNDMTEKSTNHIVISDFDYTVMKQFLWFLYSGKVDNIKKFAKSLLPVADKYDVNDLKDLCEATLLNMLSTLNACDLLVVADYYNCTKLRSETVDFIVSNIKDIFKTEYFDDLLNSHQTLIKEIFDKIIEKKC